MQGLMKRIFPYEPEDGSVLILIISMFLLRFTISAVFPMTVDETYAIAVSRVPSLSFFDHPPLGFDFARAIAWAAGSEAPLIVRFPHILFGSLTAWYIYRITNALFGQAAAFLATAWYSVAPFFFISAGHFVVPDGPLDFFLVLSFWLLLPAFIGKEPMSTARWLFAGAAMALALMSKYQAVLFGASMLIAMIWLPDARRMFLQRGPWLAFLVAALGLLPMLVWNFQHGWISFRFQTARAGDGFAAHPTNFLLMQLGQIAYLLPGTWLAALVATGRGLFRPKMPGERLLAIAVAVPVAAFDLIALVSKGSLPHWPMSGFLFAFPLAGLLFQNLGPSAGKFLQRAFHGVAVALPFLALTVAAQTHTGFLTRPFYQSAPKADVDWQLVTWSALAASFSERGIAPNPDAFIIPKNWMEGGRAAYALGPSVPVAEPLNDPRQFAYGKDARLAGRKSGYIVFQAPIGRTKETAASIKQMIAGRYVPNGEEWFVLQTRAGFPAFEIGVIPVGPL